MFEIIILLGGVLAGSYLIARARDEKDVLARITCMGLGAILAITSMLAVL